MYATDFIFDGVSLSSKGYMICSFDGDSIVSGGEIEPIVKKTPATDEYTYYAAEINNVLTWELGICKLPCGTEDFEPLNQYEESELAKWLLKTDGYRWLQFVQPDDYPDVYYKVYINMSPVQIGGQTFGYNLTITSNCGYGFSGERTYRFFSENQPLTINVDNDLNRYIYPTVTFETNADECWIYNENDLEQNLDNHKESHFHNLGDHVDVPLEITMDSANDITNGIETPDQFNFRYLKLVNGENKIYTDGILSDEHYSTTDWSEVTKYNYHPVRNYIQAGDISHIYSSNGIRTQRIAVDYELSGDGETTISGSTNTGDTITVPSDNYTTLKTKVKNLIFEMESLYNYVYLYKINHYEYKLFGCNYTLFYVPRTGVEGEFHSGSYYEQQSFDIYTITIDNITGEISNTSMSTSTYSLEEDGASFLYVPIEIKDYYGEPYIPVTRAFIPETHSERVTDNLFELDGLPSDYQDMSAFEEYIESRKVVMLRNETSYRIIDSNNDFYYYFSSDQEELEINIMITPGSGYKIYDYDVLNKTWSKTADTGGTYSQKMRINGFIGDVVYISNGARILPSPVSSYAVVNGNTYDSSYNTWEICNKGQFVNGGNYANMSNYSIGEAIHIANGNKQYIMHNEICRITLKSTFKSSFTNCYLYNGNNTSVIITVMTDPALHTYQTVTIPSKCAWKSDYDKISATTSDVNLSCYVNNCTLGTSKSYSYYDKDFSLEGLPSIFQSKEAYDDWAIDGHATILKVKTNATEYTATNNIKYILIKDCTLDVRPQSSPHGGIIGTFYQIRTKDVETPTLYEYNGDLQRWHGSPITAVQDGNYLFKIGSVDNYPVARYTDIVIDDNNGDIESSIGLEWMSGNDTSNHWQIEWYEYDSSWHYVLHDSYMASTDNKWEIYPTTLITFPLENAILTSDNAQIIPRSDSPAIPLYNAEEEKIYTCDISSVTGNVLEYSYDKYDPIESEQSGTIKFREIRRVLV